MRPRNRYHRYRREEVLIGMKLKYDLTVENKVGWVPLGEEGRQLIRIKVTSEMFRN